MSRAATLPSPPHAVPLAIAIPAQAATRDVLDATLALRHAGPRRVRIAWEAVGPEDAPCVIVAGGISAGRHLAPNDAFPEPGWWAAQVGPGAALDPTRLRLVAIDWLGADGTLDAPIASADQADAIARVLDRLGVRRAAAFVGCSYGAMVGLQFAALHPQRLERLVAIAGGDRAHPYARAWRGLQRRIVSFGRGDGASREGLALARQLALLSYRTPEDFAARVARAAEDLADADASADAWLQARSEAYVARTSPTAFLRLSESIDLHVVDPARVTVPTTLVAVAQDQLVPLQDLAALAERLPRLRRLQVLRSRFGHDAFLKEHAAIAAVLEEALADLAVDACRTGDAA
jgi:homoserine O-acetyltransferase